MRRASSSEGFSADPITREKLHVIEHAIRVRMTPREATGACATQSDMKLPPVKDLARWLWVDDCVREVRELRRDCPTCLSLSPP